MNYKDFMCSFRGESGRALYLMHKVNKQTMMCKNSQIKIFNLFEFPHIAA